MIWAMISIRKPETLGEKRQRGGAEQPRSIEIKESEIDLELYEQSLKDGTADEYREVAGALPAEALLEEQGDERVWSELSDTEKEQIRALLKIYAEANGLSVEEDDNSCIVV